MPQPDKKKTSFTYDLLKTRRTDVENIVIKIHETPETPGQGNIIDSGSINICPEKNQRFKDIPENIVGKFMIL